MEKIIQSLKWELDSINRMTKSKTKNSLSIENSEIKETKAKKTFKTQPKKNKFIKGIIASLRKGNGMSLEIFVLATALNFTNQQGQATTIFHPTILGFRSL